MRRRSWSGPARQVPVRRRHPRRPQRGRRVHAHRGEHALSRRVAGVREVVGASMNGNGSFTFRATKVGADTMLSRIIKLVEDTARARRRQISHSGRRRFRRLSCPSSSAWRARDRRNISLSWGTPPSSRSPSSSPVLTDDLPLRPGAGRAHRHHRRRRQGRRAWSADRVGGQPSSRRTKSTPSSSTSAGAVARAEPQLVRHSRLSGARISSRNLSRSSPGFFRLTASGKKASEHPLGEAILRAGAERGTTTNKKPRLRLVRATASSRI